jgi:hypothetical protein
MSELSIYNRLLPFLNNPELFETERQKILEEEFNKLPDDFQKRARQIQWVLDGKLIKYKNPVAKYNKMVDLFWTQFFELNLALDNLNVLLKKLYLDDYK